MYREEAGEWIAQYEKKSNVEIFKGNYYDWLGFGGHNRIRFVSVAYRGIIPLSNGFELYPDENRRIEGRAVIG